MSESVSYCTLMVVYSCLLSCLLCAGTDPEWCEKWCQNCSRQEGKEKNQYLYILCYVGIMACATLLYKHLILINCVYKI